jgi:hypothetical protein
MISDGSSARNLGSISDKLAPRRVSARHGRVTIAPLLHHLGVAFACDGGPVLIPVATRAAFDRFSLSQATGPPYRKH